MLKAKTSRDQLLVLSICLSAAGLFVLPLLLSQSVKFQDNFPKNNFITGVLFSSICILGMIAVFYPKNCQNTATLKKDFYAQKAYRSFPRSETTVTGHHPNCDKFEANRIKIRGFALCSACTGLFVGGVFALIGSAFYFFGGISYLGLDLRSFIIGYVFVFLGLAQFKFRKYLKIFVNFLFVIGSVILLFSASELGGSFFVDFYVLGVVAVLLMTRIRISEWYNRKTCLSCESCMFDYRR